jgi:hypothetical protein
LDRSITNHAKERDFPDKNLTEYQFLFQFRKESQARPIHCSDASRLFGRFFDRLSRQNNGELIGMAIGKNQRCCLRVFGLEKIQPVMLSKILLLSLFRSK